MLNVSPRVCASTVETRGTSDVPLSSPRPNRAAISTLPLLTVHLLTLRHLISVPALLDSGFSGNFISQALLKLFTLDPHFCRARTGVSSVADFCPTVKVVLRHESVDSEEEREGLGCHLGQS